MPAVYKGLVLFYKVSGMPGTRSQHAIPRLILAPVTVMDLKYQELAGTGASVPADIMWHLFGNQIILSAGQLVPFMENIL